MGGAGPNGNRLRSFYDALGRARGDAYDTTQTSNVSAETVATARLVASIWSTNQRMANQWDPLRMTTSLPRWEKILNIVPLPTDSDTTRRARIQAISARTGQAPFTTYLSAQLAALLGPVFVAVEYISVGLAVIHVPDGTYPFGTVVPGTPWSSTTAHILIRTQVPAGYKESDFQAAIGLVAPFMDAVAPAWVTFDWYRPGPVYTAILGGPSASGFYLDDPHNLDNEVFNEGAPVAVALSPNTLDGAGSRAFVITGTGLGTATDVKASGTSIPFTITGGTIYATAPSGAGMYDI